MDAQTLIVLALVLAAAAYVGLRLRRTIASARRKDCGGDCGCSPK